MAKALLKRYSERLHKLMEQGKQSGGLDADLDVDNASVLFIGTIQGLVMQSLIAGNVAQMRAGARCVCHFSARNRGAAMMGRSLTRRTWTLVGVMVPLLALFAYVALRSGPLAPVSVTTTTVESRPLSPALFGIGTVEARHTYKIGPTIAARVKQLYVDVGDQVESGQLLGEMEPVDLDDRIRAQDAAVKRAAAALQEAESRQAYAKAEAHRYEQLLTKKLASDEMVAGKRQELKISDVALEAAREDLARSRHDHQALVAQRDNLRLVAPVAGLVVAREADPGTTMIAGQAVVQLIDPCKAFGSTRVSTRSARLA